MAEGLIGSFLSFFSKMEAEMHALDKDMLLFDEVLNRKVMKFKLYQLSKSCLHKIHQFNLNDC